MKSRYVIEAWGLGTFMLVAGTVAVALRALPPAPSAWIAAHPIAGRAVFGCAMGVTAVSIVYSSWGMRSGAHLNPAVTLTFARLGKIPPREAAWYVVAQFAGGALGLAVAAALFGSRLSAPPISAIVTKPGAAGVAVAFVAEAAMTFALMLAVLALANARPAVARFSGVAAGTLVALFITFEAPLSGMSLNPARTLASAVVGHDWTAIWIYFTAPPLGMLLAAACYVAVAGAAAVRCARVNHHGPDTCPFRCTYHDAYAKTRA